MDGLPVGSSRAQMKIQEMAFMLVAIMVFFSLVGMIYFTISISGLKAKAEDLRDQEARETVKKTSGLPEFTFTATTDCTSCVDLDKIIFMKENKKYEELWNFDYVMIERLDPSLPDVECTTGAGGNYPNCKRITLIKKRDDFGTPASAFVTLSRWDPNLNPEWFKYELGRIYASGENVK